MIDLNPIPPPDGPPGLGDAARVNDGRTLVAYMRRGVAIAAVEVPGRLLEPDLPTSVRLEHDGPHRVYLVETDDPILECTGVLLLPWISPSGPGATPIVIPPPPPFARDEVRAMWEARNALDLARRRSTSGLAPWSTMEARLSNRLHWEALADAVHAARALLGAWPTRPRPSVSWQREDRPGGRILVGTTERHPHRTHPIGSRGDATGAGVVRPTVTARRTFVYEERRLQALATIAHLLATRLPNFPGITAEPRARDAMIRLFRRVTVRASQTRPVADPQPSEWPPPIRRAYAAMLRVLTLLSATGSGRDDSPLSELWELYEAWVAVTVRDALGASLIHGSYEQMPTPVDVPTCIARWTRADGAVVELHTQVSIPTGSPVNVGGKDFVAAVGGLQPDLLTVYRSRNGDMCAVVVDAKKRSGVVTPDDLTVNTSKYLWGLRDPADDASVPTIEHVILVAPLGGVSAARPVGRGSTLRARPAEVDLEEFGNQILSHFPPGITSGN